MKGKGIIMILIILLCIIVIGLIAFLCIAINGKNNFKWKFNIGNKSDEIIYDKTYETDTINNIDVSSTAGDIKFEESTDGKIKVVVYGEKDGNLKVDYNDNNLKVDYPGQKNNSFFNFNFRTSEIIVYIPKSYDRNINIKLNYGDVRVLDLKSASINIEEDCGDIKVGEVKDITIKNCYGDTEIESVLNKLDIESNCGDIRIKEVNLLEKSTIKNDYGDIRIGKTNDIYVDAKVDLGDTKINANNRYSDVVLKIEASCGDIKVEN